MHPDAQFDIDTTQLLFQNSSQPKDPMTIKSRLKQISMRLWSSPSPSNSVLATDDRTFVVNEAVPKVTKTWEVSQNYEMEHAITFMDTPEFRALAETHRSGQATISRGYVNELMLREFFANDKNEWLNFVKHITGKNCLEIGPAVLSAMTGWDVARERHVLEPLLLPIEKWQRENLGYSLFEGLQNYPVGAETLLPEIVSRIDGAIFCRNCLDHTPQWPFILGNISAYASSGCRLLLWLDLDHRGVADEGHYDITTDPSVFKRLVESLGFTIVREYEDRERQELNWGCFAVKT